MADLRKLVAIDIAFLGRTFILMEFAAAIALAPALGIFVLVRSHARWQMVLGGYIACLGINYIPMLIYANQIKSRDAARAILGDELNNKAVAMARYRRQSLLLLVPFLAPVLAWSRRIQPRI